MADFPKTAEIVIIGGGVMGASTAYHLAKHGAKNVVLLEKEPFFGHGSTSRSAGGFRYQFGTEVNIQLSIESIRMLEKLEDETGQPALMRRCGYLFLLSNQADVEAFKKNVALQHSLGVMTEWLSSSEAQAKAAPCVFPDVLAGTFYGPEGVADPGSVVTGYMNAAHRLGVNTLTEVQVTGIAQEGGHVCAVETNRGRIATRTIISTTGAWSSQIGNMVGLEIPIEPVRRQWLTTTPMPEIPPSFPLVIDFTSGLYYRREGLGLLTGMSNHDEPAAINQTVDREWELVHLEKAMQHLPALEHAGIASRSAGMYEITPDAHPIIGATPVGGFYILGGFSGHGFQHGAISGKLMSEIVLDGRAHTVDVSMLGLNRFAEGKLMEEYNVV
jgi:sarcosine oxidase subunit beta